MKVEDIDCPLCGSQAEHKQVESTHIWVCDSCPFIGMEFVQMSNAHELLAYLAP